MKNIIILLATLAIILSSCKGNEKTDQPLVDQIIQDYQSNSDDWKVRTIEDGLYRLSTSNRSVQLILGNNYSGSRNYLDGKRNGVQMLGYTEQEKFSIVDQKKLHKTLLPLILPLVDEMEEKKSKKYRKLFD